MGVPRNPMSLGTWGFTILFVAFLGFWMLDALHMGLVVKLVGAAVVAAIGLWLMLINHD
jgi:hypothetical protein